MGKKQPKQGAHSRAARKQVFKVLLWQAVLIVLLSGGLLLVGKVEAISALCGGLIYLIPNLYFASRALANGKEGGARNALAQMYVSEIWKMSITILLFAAVFILVRPLSPFSLFGTFILMHLIYWVTQIKANNRFLKL